MNKVNIIYPVDKEPEIVNGYIPLQITHIKNVDDFSIDEVYFGKNAEYNNVDKNKEIIKLITSKLAVGGKFILCGTDLCATCTDIVYGILEPKKYRDKYFGRFLYCIGEIEEILKDCGLDIVIKKFDKTNEYVVEAIKI